MFKLNSYLFSTQTDHVKLYSTVESNKDITYLPGTIFLVQQYDENGK